MSRRTPRSVKASCDKLFSQIIRSQGFCTKCGSRDNLQTAHIFSRKYNSVRWDEDNALCLCAKCHRWAHDNPVEFVEYVKQIKPIEKLAKRKETLGRFKLWQFIEIEEKLKDQTG